MARIWRHMKELWPRLTLLPPAPFVLWGLYCLARGERRWELPLIILGVPLLAYSSRASKRLYWAILPFGLVGLLYDAMRFVKNLGVSESTVHICDLRAAEMKFFGLTAGGVRMTVHDWFQAHPVRALDLL